MALIEYINEVLKYESFFNQIEDSKFIPLTHSLWNEMSNAQDEKENFTYCELKLESTDIKGLKSNLHETDDKFKEFENKLQKTLTLHLNREDGRVFVIRNLK